MKHGASGFSNKIQSEFRHSGVGRHNRFIERTLGSGPLSVVLQLCAFGQLPFPLWVLLSPPVTLLNDFKALLQPRRSANLEHAAGQHL